MELEAGPRSFPFKWVDFKTTKQSKQTLGGEAGIIKAKVCTFPSTKEANPLCEREGILEKTASKETGNGACGPAQEGTEAMGSFHLERQGAFFSVIIIFKAVFESLLPVFPFS